MQQEEFTFEICYNGQQIKVKPLTTDEVMLYIVDLPDERIMIENDMDGSRQYWIENGEAETQRANEIGALIESRDM